MTIQCYNSENASLEISGDPVGGNPADPKGVLADYATLGGAIPGLETYAPSWADNVVERPLQDAVDAKVVCIASKEMTIAISGVICPGDQAYDLFRATHQACIAAYFRWRLQVALGFEEYTGPATIRNFAYNPVVRDTMQWSASLVFTCYASQDQS